MTFKLYFELLAGIVFYCVGWYRITRKGMVLGFISEWFDRTREIKGNKKLIGQEHIVPDWIADPIVACIFCIASVHGTIFYAMYFIFSDLQLTLGNVLVDIPLCISAAALNGIVYGVLKNLLPKQHHD